MPVLAIFSDLTISGNKVALRFLNHSLRLPTSSSSTSPSPNRNISSKWRNPNLRYQNWCRTHRSGLPTSSLVCSSVATAAMHRTAPTGANRRTGLYTSICGMPLVCLGQDLVLLTIVASTFLLGGSSRAFVWLGGESLVAMQNAAKPYTTYASLCTTYFRRIIHPPRSIRSRSWVLQSPFAYLDARPNNRSLYNLLSIDLKADSFTAGCFTHGYRENMLVDSDTSALAPILTDPRYIVRCKAETRRRELQNMEAMANGSIDDKV
jgi:hypothetical protein